jgi:hypothetical protein
MLLPVNAGNLSPDLPASISLADSLAHHLGLEDAGYCHAKLKEARKTSIPRQLTALQRFEGVVQQLVRLIQRVAITTDETALLTYCRAVVFNGFQNSREDYDGLELAVGLKRPRK